MSRSPHRRHNSSSSSQNLYPVVQDLTEAEYGTEVCCGGMIGSSAMEDLVLPNINARSLPASPSESEFPPDSTHKNRINRHSRGQSLFQFPTSMVANTHKRSNSAPSTVASCPTADTAPTDSSEDDGGEGDMTSFDDIFVLTRQIYRCNVSTIWECVHREEGTRHCVKMIDKRRFTCKADKEAALREIGMLTSLQTYQSKFVPRLVQVSEDDYQYYLVMDYVEGGNLAGVQNARHHFSEDHVRAIARSLLLGLAEMHRLSVAHFDLNPDNVLLHPNLCDVVLCDFGHAWDLENADFTTITNSLGSGTATIHSGSTSVASNGTSGGPRCGNLLYAAPELIGPHKEFGLAADMWSVGVILYQLFCGQLPFEDVSKRALKEKIVSGKFKFQGQEWHGVSRSAKQFISTLLHSDPQVRMTVGEALTHPWMTQSGDDASRDGSPSKRSNRDRKHQRPSLMQRLLGRLRCDTVLDSVASTSYDKPEQPAPLKLNAGRMAADLSPGSTLSVTTTVSQGSASPLHQRNLSTDMLLESTLPRPLDEYRWPRPVGT